MFCFDLTNKIKYLLLLLFLFFLFFLIILNLIWFELVVLSVDPSEKSIEIMRKFSEQYARKSGTYFCVDKGVTSVVIKVHIVCGLYLPQYFDDEYWIHVFVFPFAYWNSSLKYNIWHSSSVYNNNNNNLFESLGVMSYIKWGTWVSIKTRKHKHFI